MTDELKQGMKQADEFVNWLIEVLNKDLDWKEATINSTKKEKYAAL